MPIQRIFIIHGTNGNSNENWFPWLKEELVKANPDIKAIVPDFPTGNNQSLENWLEAFEPFIKKDFDWNKIRSNCADFTVYASDNDPYVSIDKSRFVADRTNAKFKVVHGAGYFNAAAGYLKFEELLEDIKSIIE